MSSTVPDLLAMTQQQLDDLFRASPPGEIPNGPARGTAVIAPATALARIIASLVYFLLWQGKVFDAQQRMLKNLVSIFRVKAIAAQVYKEPSWLDGQECIVLDYSKTSVVARKIRDEIRLVGPGLYLGKVYWGTKRLIDFSLQF